MWNRLFTFACVGLSATNAAIVLHTFPQIDLLNLSAAIVCALVALYCIHTQWPH